MKRVVVKIGTGVLTDNTGKLNEEIISGIVSQISALRKKGIEVIIVSSGAIGAGMWLLNKKKKSNDLAELQSMASIGQARLMDIYNKYFKRRSFLTGQILLTQEDFNSRKRYLNIKYTINTLLKHKAIPVVNENDTISTEEIKCGDNDRISSLVSDLAEADALIILTNVDGVLDKDGILIKEIDQLSEENKKLASDKCDFLGTGGMYTKLCAAEFVAKSGIDCYIANGRKKRIIQDILKGKNNYTYIRAKVVDINARKRWIGFGSKPKGHVIIDDGALIALAEKNKSLLATGICDVQGRFEQGDIVTISAKNKKEAARGISNYSSKELSAIKGVKTKDIESVLGYKDHDEVVHRDNLVIFS